MKIVRDNCKGCNSSCENAGKDREFVCVKGVSCKTVKTKPYMVAVVRCKDCKYHINLWCSMIPAFEWTDDDDFCSYGERKEIPE